MGSRLCYQGWWWRRWAWWWRRCIRWWCCNSGGQWSQRVHGYMVLDELRPVTKAAAIELQRACPWVVFTSGYRSWMDQARAMAQNVVKSRTWLGQVYKHEPELQAWVDAHPNIIDVEAIENG